MDTITINESALPSDVAKLKQLVLRLLDIQHAQAEYIQKIEDEKSLLEHQLKAQQSTQGE